MSTTADGMPVPRYRFSWDRLPAALTRRLARDLQLTGDPVTALRTAYGARPDQDFVSDSWPHLRAAWLAKNGPARRSVVELLRERRLGDLAVPVGNRQEQLDYLASCRNSASLRQVVLEQFRTYGSSVETSPSAGTANGAVEPANPDGTDDSESPDNTDRPDHPDQSGTRAEHANPNDPAEPEGGPGERVIRRHPPEFDLDKRLAVAWAQLRSRLAEALDGLGDEESMSIQLPSAYDEQDLDGAIPYLQFAGYDEGSVRGEVSSNHVLDERHRLSDIQGRALLDLGWSAPASNPDDPEGDDGPNFWIDVRAGSIEELAAASVEAIRDVFGVPHPSFLIAQGARGEATAESLGIPGPPRQPAQDHAATTSADEPMAIEPVNRDHLVELVDTALVSVVGERPAHDDDGDIPIRAGSAIVFVRVADDGPYIELFSPILVGVQGSPLALERISQLNRWVRFVSFGWDSGTVHASMHLFCQPFVPDHLRHAVHVLTSVADRLDDELRLGLGGRVFFGNEHESDDSGGDGSGGDGSGGDRSADGRPGGMAAPSAEDAPDAEEAELPEALLTLMQLDAHADGAVSAEEAADICGRNRRDILDYIRISEQQVIEWRSAADEALSEGDNDEWAASVHEGKAWQSTVDLLRSALRLVARR